MLSLLYKSGFRIPDYAPRHPQGPNTVLGLQYIDSTFVTPQNAKQSIAQKKKVVGRAQFTVSSKTLVRNHQHLLSMTVFLVHLYTCQRPLTLYTIQELYSKKITDILGSKSPPPSWPKATSPPQVLQRGPCRVVSIQCEILDEVAI